MKTIKKITALLLLSVMVLNFTHCKKDKETKDEENVVITKKTSQVLKIDQGAKSIKPDEKITYSATFIKEDGSVIPATSITWKSSNEAVATVDANGTVTSKGTGQVTITATATVDGVTYTNATPLGIIAPCIFAVAPAAIIYEKGYTMQLETIYFSPNAENPTYTFTSSNPDIASVSSTGLVSFVNIGECVITIKSSVTGNPSTIVPVMVVGIPEIPLPVSRIVISDESFDLFKNETKQLTAKAYNTKNEEVSNPITWTTDNPNIAIVSSNGLVTPVNPGETNIRASASGIFAQATVVVNPDTMVWVDPMFVSVAAGAKKQLTATAYLLRRAGATKISGVDISWEIPTFGFSMFDVATISNTGLVTMKANAMPGMFAMAIAYLTKNPNIGGVGTISVALATACDCGTGNASVASISVPSSSISLSFTNATATIGAKALNLNGQEVENAGLVYCSDNMQVANASSDGTVTMAGMVGTATIKICSGSYAEKTVTVNVTAK